MFDVEDEGQPTPVRVKEVGTTKVACLMLSSVGFEDVVSRLKAFEERIRGDDGGEEQQLVMFTRVTGSGGSSSSSGSGSDGHCDGGSGAGSSNDAGGGGRSSSGGAGSSNDVGGQRLLFVHGGGLNGSSGGRRGGVFSGVSGSGDWLREMKGKWERIITGVRVLFKVDLGHQTGRVDPVCLLDLGQKPKIIINPTSPNPIINQIVYQKNKKPLARIKFKEMRSLIGIEDISRRT